MSTQTTATARPVRNINENLGDPVVFESLEAMEASVRELDKLNPGENYFPQDGLQEGRDYELVEDGNGDED